MGTDDRHDDLVLPLKIGAVSNGEFLPRRPGPLAHEAIRRTIEHAETALRLGAHELPAPVKGVMRMAAKLMTTLTYRI